MFSKKQTQRHDKAVSRQPPSRPTTENVEPIHQVADPATTIRQSKHDHRSPAAYDVLHLQRTVGNQVTGQLLTGMVQRHIIQRQTWTELWEKVATYMDKSAQEWFNIAEFLNMRPVPKAEEFGHRSGKSKEGSERANSRLFQLRADVWKASRIPDEMPRQKALAKLKKFLQAQYGYRG